MTPAFRNINEKGKKRITIFAPKIYTAPCIMFWMRAYPLQGEVGGGWALEFSSFLGPVKWHRADRRVPFHRAQGGGGWALEFSSEMASS